jgi:hypothetical protein
LVVFSCAEIAQGKARLLCARITLITRQLEHVRRHYSEGQPQPAHKKRMAFGKKCQARHHNPVHALDMKKLRIRNIFVPIWSRQRMRAQH